MVSNKSLEVNAALAEGAKQATFEKEAQTPSGTGTPASPPRPHGQPAETPAEQNGSGKTPLRSLSTNSAQPNGNQLDLEGQNAVNKVMLAGRLCRDAEVRHTKGGQIVANFSLGTQESYKDRLGEWQKKDCVAPGSSVGRPCGNGKRKPAARCAGLCRRKAHHPQLDRQAKPEAPLHGSGGKRCTFPYAGSKQWGAKRERTRRRAYRRLAMTENLGLSRACSRASPKLPSIDFLDNFLPTCSNARLYHSLR